jgi:phage terminase large subunit-like protein
MVRHTIKTANPSARVKVVTASRGKHIRAEPVSAVYEESAGERGGAYTGRMHHCGRFDALEDELCNTTTAGYSGNDSPNRLDALVWACTELFGKQVVGSDNLIASGSLARIPRENV